jgi:hypothetical protein
MNGLYSYHDYEEAYFHGRAYDCKKIGLYLLGKLKDDRSKKLYKQLESVEYAWDLPRKKLDKLAEVLLNVKI